tara:strand:+ start:819 stop:1703 length:885 start_codon:yes stop_codon:yes gene_type:complete
MHREVWYGSPVAAGLDNNSETVNTITFNERTVADVSRLVGYASADNIATSLGYSGYSFIDSVQVTDLTLYGSDLLIVGRNSPTASLPLAADRFVGAVGDHRFNLSRFGRLPFASSDTIALTMGLSAAAVNVEGSSGIAVPGTSNLMSDAFAPKRPPQYLGEGGGATIATGAAADLVLTADRAGWVPLSDLTIAQLQTAALTGHFGAPLSNDDLGSLYITQIELPGSDLLVRGSGTGTVPAAAYRANRQGNAINHGGLWMDAGSAITISVVNIGPVACTVQAGIPFFAAESKGAC